VDLLQLSLEALLHGVDVQLELVFLELGLLQLVLEGLLVHGELLEVLEHVLVVLAQFGAGLVLLLVQLLQGPQLLLRLKDGAVQVDHAVLELCLLLLLLLRHLRAL
jgi:hypothetical protein